MATLGKLEYLISIDSSKLNSGLNSAEGKFKGFGNKLSSWAVAKGQIIAKLVESAGKATISFVKGAVQDSMSFDKSMSQVAATLGTSVSEIKQLSDFAREMGSKTAFTAEEAAQGLNYMALAGYDAQKSMKMLPQVMNLAAAGNFNLARASDMVTDAQSALGLSIEDTETLVDQMAKTASKTNTSVEQLGEAILTVGGTAKIMGEDTYQLNAVLGILADNGIKGSEGGTALRNVLLSLSAPTDKASKAIKSLGVQIYDNKGNMRNMEDIMLDMNEAMDGMTSKERTDIISKIFNKRDLKAVEALLGTSKKRWEELYGEIDNAKGAAEQMAETQLDNLDGDVTKFKSALGEAKLTLVEGLTPSLRNFTKIGTVAIDRLTKAFKRGGLSGAFKELKNILGDMKGGFKKWAAIKLSDYTGLGDDASWADIARGMINKIKKNLKTKKLKIAEALDVPNPEDATWGDIGSKIMQGLTTKISKGGAFFKKLILGDKYVEGKSTWTDVGDSIFGWITSAFEGKDIIGTLFDNAEDKLSGVINFAGKLLTGFATWFSNSENVQKFVGMVTSMVQSIADHLDAILPPLVNALAQVLTNPEIWKALGNIGMTILDAIFGEGFTAGLRQMLGLNAPSAESVQRGKAQVEGLEDSENVDEVLAGYGDSAEADEARSLYRKYKADKEAGKRWDKESLNEMYAAFDAANQASGGVVENVEELSEEAMTAKEHISELFSFMQEDEANRPLEKYREHLQEYLELAGLTGEELNKAMDQLDYSKLKTAFAENGEEGVSELINQVLGENQYEAEVDPALGDTSAFENSLNSAGFTARVGIRPFYKGTPLAKGAWTVPYDNYPALLHRNERVLTASQARQSNGGGMDYAAVGEMIAGSVENAMSRVYVMLNGDKVGDLTTKRISKNVNAQSYSRLRALGG